MTTADYTKPSSTALVQLVGAGPGDPGLLTVKGRSFLSRADIIIYDYLANETLLRYAKVDAKRIFVGKKGFCEHVTQAQINDCIVHEARQNPGALIVRLKGGDPFVFGRGGEEALALVKAGIPFEIVPGVTAGVAAPAFAGIPVTHRGVASSLAFITGHETPEKNESSIDWEHLANGVDTLCFYMGIRNLPLICARLKAAGRASDTPVALVRWGSLPVQETLVSTLDEVVEAVERVGFEAPAIIVVGEVVRLREQLAWFENKPFHGKRIVVTRSCTQASITVASLAEKGASVFEFPTIRIEQLGETPEMARAIDELATYDWVVFTSKNGVDGFFATLAARGLDARAFRDARIAAIGPATRAALEAQGIRGDLMPQRYVAEEAAAALLEQGAAGSRVLLPRASCAREVLPEMLRAQGAQVDVVAVYRTVADDTARAADLAHRLECGEVDAVTFTSSSTVHNCIALLQTVCEGEGKALALLRRVKLCSIGPVTSDTLREYGLKSDIEAQDYTIDGLIQAMEALL